MCAFGPVSQYFSSIETNSRFALHLHGLLWFYGNIHSERLLPDLVDHGSEEEIEEFLQWVGERFQQDFDEKVSN